MHSIATERCVLNKIDPLQPECAPDRIQAPLTFLFDEAVSCPINIKSFTSSKSSAMRPSFGEIVGQHGRGHGGRFSSMSIMLASP
jgi:hypothetical protein